MKISSGVDTQELLAMLREGGYLSVGGAPLNEILTRLEQAEQLVQINNQAMLEQAQRAEQAEQAVERVRTLTNVLSWSPNHVAIVQRYRNALDGEPNE